MASMIRFDARARWLSWVCLAALTAFGLTACEPTTVPPRCTINNCAGCCSSSGECFGTSRQAADRCGVGGAQCKACGLAEDCVSGRCTQVVFDAGFDAGTQDAGPLVCGASGQGCCPGGRCNSGLDCRAGRCNPCGAQGLNCCGGTGCNAPLLCYGNTCEPPDAGPPPCGDAGMPCCTGAACNPGHVCSRGLCEEQCGIFMGSCCNVAGTATCGQGLTCMGSPMCTSGVSCTGGRCELPFTRPDSGVVDAGQPQNVGGPCTLSTDCLTGLYCQVAGFQGGYCTKSCNTTCPAGSDSTCSLNPANPGGSRICLKNCSARGTVDPINCRSAYVCDSQPSSGVTPTPQGVCTPQCTTAAVCGLAPSCDARGFCCGSTGWACCNGTMCGGGQMCSNSYCVNQACGAAGQPCCSGGPGQPNNVCNPNHVCGTSGTCTRCGGAGEPCCAGNVCQLAYVCRTSTSTCQMPETNKQIGESCTSPTQCLGGTCIVENGQGFFQGGYCSQNCSSNSCPAGTFCSSNVIPGQTLCFQGCTYSGGSGGCRSNYVCDRGTIPNNFAQAVCLGACTTDSQCPTGRCESGFCCGRAGYKCCTTGFACNTGTCTALDYCQ